MKTKRVSRVRKVAEHRTLAGRRVVILEEAEYQRLRAKADEWEPSLPEPNERGNYPLEALDVVLALDIIRTRRRLGMTQNDLARRAGIPPETLCRIERGKRKPNLATVEKIDRALKLAEASARANGRTHRKSKS